MTILIVGCSFSEDINLDNTQSWSYLLRDYLKNESINIVNLSQSGQGNGVISDLVMDYVSNSNVDLVLIQWSAFTRIYPNEVLSKHWNKYKNLDWIEEGDNIDLLTKESTLHSLNTIIETQKFLKNKNIDYRMWFGWQQVYPEQIKEFGYTNMIEDIESDDNFLLFQQNDMWDDELEGYGLFSKSNYAITLSKMTGLFKGENYYYKTKWGGMSEYIRMNLNKGKYISKTDFHPSSNAHKLFFDDIIKPLFNNINEKTKLI